MGIALTTLSTLVRPLRHLARWLHHTSPLAQQSTAHATPVTRPAQAPAPHDHAVTPDTPRAPQNRPAILPGQRPPRGNWPFTVNPPAPSARTRSRLAQAPGRGFLPLAPSCNATGSPWAAPATARRPNMVVRKAAAPGGTGRLVIAGRMADVCAELDRLAASEAALQAYGGSRAVMHV